MTSNSKKGHSEEFFGNYRDFWWNSDFLDLMARRWRLHEVECALDVGCGLGHWSEQIFRLLPTHSIIHGVDLDSKWVEKTPARMQSIGLGERFSMHLGSADALPFPDNHFDLVTCQTVLIHVADIAACLSEMRRVTKPGGIISVAEPNNIASFLVLDSLSKSQPVDELLESIRFALLCERGKAALGRGDSSVGDLLPGHFANAGLDDIQVFLSDKASPLFPPYASAEQKVLLEQFKVWDDEDVIVEDRELSLRSYLQAGGSEIEFDDRARKKKLSFQRFLRSIEQGEYHGAGAAIMYLVSGRKR